MAVPLIHFKKRCVYGLETEGLRCGGFKASRKKGPFFEKKAPFFRENCVSRVVLTRY